METAETPFIYYPEGFDARSEEEMTLKGYLSDVEIGMADGRRFLVNLIDPIRLAQELEGESANGRPYFAEPGLIVVPEVTKGGITTAILSLWREGYFESLKPIQLQNGATHSAVASPQASIRSIA